MIIIKKAVLPDCPYCGAEVCYLESFVIKNKPVYKCRSCGKKSSVNLKSIIYNIIGVLQIVCIAVFLLMAAIGGSFALFGIFLIILMFLGFYSISPFMVVLDKPDIKKQKKKKKRSDINKSSNSNSNNLLIDENNDFSGTFKLESRDIFSNSDDRDIFSN